MPKSTETDILQLIELSIWDHYIFFHTIKNNYKIVKLHCVQFESGCPKKRKSDGVIILISGGGVKTGGGGIKTGGGGEKMSDGGENGWFVVKKRREVV